MSYILEDGDIILPARGTAQKTKHYTEEYEEKLQIDLAGIHEAGSGWNLVLTCLQEEL